MSSSWKRGRLTEASESAVAALAVSGDADAFEELVRRRQGMIRRLMHQLCGDGAMADDFAQEAFLKAWQKLSSLNSPGAFGGWLRRIAVNIFLQHARRKSLMKEDSDEAASNNPVAAEDSTAKLDLDDALGKLKPAERLCIVLSYSERMSHGEICLSTGLPLGTVKSHISRGSARLRRYLKDYEGDV